MTYPGDPRNLGGGEPAPRLGAQRSAPRNPITVAALHDANSFLDVYQAAGSDAASIVVRPASLDPRKLRHLDALRHEASLFVRGLHVLELASMVEAAFQQGATRLTRATGEMEPTIRYNTNRPYHHVYGEVSDFYQQNIAHR